MSGEIIHLADEQAKQKSDDGTKLCKSCRRRVPFLGFSRNKYSPDGLNFYCRECQNAKQRKRQNEFVQRAGSKRS